MQTFKDKILQKLHAYLVQRESEPTRDAANVIIPNGVTATATIQAIKDCIKIIKDCKDEL